MVISENEINRRNSQIINYLNKNRLDGFIITDPYNIFYLDFYHISTERPVIYFIHSSGEITLFVPSMEEVEAMKIKHIDILKVYFEFPGEKDVFKWIIQELKSIHPHLKNIVIDNAEERLFQKWNAEFDNLKVNDFIYQMRLIKSDEEVEYLKMAANYSDFIVDYGIKHCHPGKSELELLAEMEIATIRKMVQELNEIIYVPGGPAGGLIPSGERTLLPHALPSSRIIQEGDTIFFSCGANIKGYRTECERTCFVSEPDKLRKKAFKIMKDAQVLGISLMKPGNLCSDIDKQVLDFIRKKGYGDYIRHRTGHGKGLQEHEIPWVEIGDHTVLQKGMILSSEPGIYIEGLSGFRHSDTVLVTEKEPEVLTKYSKELEDLVIEV